MLVYKKKTKKKYKSAKQIERHLKGVANHRRIEILFLISENPGITLDNIAGGLSCNMKTISEHTRRLEQAGLVRKDHKGRTVVHELSPYGRTFCKFLRTFQISDAGKINSIAPDSGANNETTYINTRSTVYGRFK